MHLVIYYADCLAFKKISSDAKKDIILVTYTFNYTYALLYCDKCCSCIVFMSIANIIKYIFMLTIINDDSEEKASRL